ncbi:hypothetical protein F7725_025186 [Dissostichus mawsoni]|uniref:Uncharacterized protein n=1 Tax=Dissostichus mawsoni TaxID=36200 RepID=A0A7J5XAF9_DISMA|nr:hypothetical protein F7725_025186 [Dissostichus mawsoni]
MGKSQLQAGETLRNTSHSSTAADLLQARQQLMQYQPQLEELQLKLSEMETLGRRSEESFIQRINEKDLLIAEQDKVIMSREQSLTEIRTVEKSFAQTLKEKTELTAIITEQERSLTLLREELVHVARTTDDNIIGPSEKDLIIAEHERVISERDYSLTQLEDELESSEKHLCDLKQRMAAKEAEFERCMDESENNKAGLESCKSEIERCKLEWEKDRVELESCKNEMEGCKLDWEKDRVELESCKSKWRDVN